MQAANVISLAVKAAGGYNAVAKALDCSYSKVSQMVTRKTMPAWQILKVCEMGGNQITPIQVLQFITESKKDGVN